MSFFKKNKTIVLIIVILIVGFFGYRFLFPSSSDEGLVVQPVAATASPEGDLLGLLLELKSLQLDEALFDDGVFNSLQDFSTDIVAEPVGRTNPFLPIGTEGIVPPPPETPVPPEV